MAELDQRTVGDRLFRVGRLAIDGDIRRSEQLDRPVAVGRAHQGEVPPRHDQRVGRIDHIARIRIAPEHEAVGLPPLGRLFLSGERAGTMSDGQHFLSPSQPRSRDRSARRQAGGEPRQLLPRGGCILPGPGERPGWTLKLLISLTSTLLARHLRRAGPAMRPQR